jgi:hypothetical protein
MSERGQQKTLTAGEILAAAEALIAKEQEAFQQPFQEDDQNSATGYLPVPPTFNHIRGADQSVGQFELKIASWFCKTRRIKVMQTVTKEPMERINLIRSEIWMASKVTAPLLRFRKNRIRVPMMTTIKKTKAIIRMIIVWKLIGAGGSWFISIFES